ncbi:metallophosphoesterase [Metabacillus sp. YM-086]|uniref:metallophosphoesterase n=1 Tax=Metabacillus TaxID=2675233 RepID=UPI000EF55D68|nr:metallophosphoesterase [Metabacillus litoralis]
MIKFKKLFILILTFLIIMVIYTIWDNNRVAILEEDILVEDLPNELEGFKILQISDLHEKEFGQNQENLIKKINSINYDILALTGDYLKDQESTNYSATYKILDGIYNKEHVLFVPGNTDPYVNVNGSMSKNPFILGLEQRGVKLLNSIYMINKDGASVEFVNFEFSILTPTSKSEIPNYGEPTTSVKDIKHLLTEMDSLKNENNSNVLIALSHYPVVDARIDQIMENPAQIFRNYDLIMAGHYHGGQIRLPFVGALFVPEAWYERNGLFPPQNRVKGLWEYRDTKQYVSAGLGSSNTIPLLSFRFLNTPEINVLTLKRE